MISKIDFESTVEIKTFAYTKLSKYGFPVLLQVIVEDEVSLYIKQEIGDFLHDALFVSYPLLKTEEVRKTTYYLKRLTDDYTTALNGGLINLWKKNTLEFFKDCPLLVEKIKSKEFKEKDLKEIVEFYNDNCYAELLKE